MKQIDLLRSKLSAEGINCRIERKSDSGWAYIHILRPAAVGVMDHCIGRIQFKDGELTRFKSNACTDADYITWTRAMQIVQGHTAKILEYKTRPVEPEEEQQVSNPNLNQTVALMQTGYTTVQVAFHDFLSLPEREDILVKAATDSEAPWAKDPNVRITGYGRPAPATTYRYKCPLSVANSLKPGDIVLVPPSSSRGIGLGLVYDIDAEPEINVGSNIEYKWLIGKVDFEAYHQLMEREAGMVHAIKKANEAKLRRQTVDALRDQFPEGSEARVMFDKAQELGRLE